MNMPVMNMTVWRCCVHKMLCLTVGLGFVLLCYTAPAEAMRIIGHEGTIANEDSPQTALTIYNETTKEIDINYLPGNRFSRRLQNYDYHDIAALQRIYAQSADHRIVPGGKLQYRGLWPNPWVVDRDGLIGNIGFGIWINGQRTRVSLYLHGETGNGKVNWTTPYDLDWSEEVLRENVRAWHSHRGEAIPDTGNLKTKEEDRISRYAFQSSIDGKWYIMTLLLGYRASGTMHGEPTHLVIVFQEANKEMME